MEENCNTLIRQAVRAVLKPKGMCQKSVGHWSVSQ